MRFGVGRRTFRARGLAVALIVAFTVSLVATAPPLAASGEILYDYMHGSERAITFSSGTVACVGGSFNYRWVNDNGSEPADFARLYDGSGLSWLYAAGTNGGADCTAGIVLTAGATFTPSWALSTGSWTWPTTAAAGPCTATARASGPPHRAPAW